MEDWGPHYARAAQNEVGGLIDKIGDASFGSSLAGFLGRCFQVDHIFLVRSNAIQPDVRASISADGSGYAEAQSRAYMAQQLWHAEPDAPAIYGAPDSKPLVMHLDVTSPMPSALRSYMIRQDVRSRTTIAGYSAGGQRYALAMAWSKRTVDWREQPMAIGFLQHVVFPIFKKHFETMTRKTSVEDVISSVPEIEARLHGLMGSERPREIQVASRIIYGYSADDIACDLKIAKETVITHRKRLYGHLDVQNSRELLLWYLSVVPGV